MAEVKIDLRPLKRVVRKYPEVANKVLKTTFRTYLRHLQRRLTTERLTAGGGGEGLNVRSGQLRRSFKVTVTGEFATLRGLLSTHVPYARIHEYGGEIVPKTARKLWIPSDLMRTPAGVFKGWEAIPWERVFYRKSKSNPANVNALLQLDVRGGGTAVRVIATLVDRVTIKPSLGLRALTKQDRPALGKVLHEALKRIVKEAAA
jgi:phage gpG-like protein